jgi:signal transduction histidine kinase
MRQIEPRSATALFSLGWPMLPSKQRAVPIERWEAGESRLRLQTIVRLRWVAIIGQLTTVLIVHFLLGFDLPLLACLAIIGLSALLNVVMKMRFPPSKRLKSDRAALMLGYDLLQLTALLFLTGGLQNPFALLMVVPTAISASTQPLRITVGLCALSVVCATILIVEYLPLPWAPGTTLTLPLPYMIGVWTALVSCITFMAAYARRTAQENRQMFDALTATELRLAREQKLSALDGLAAAAAHELGTPLSTIFVVTKELEREIPADRRVRPQIPASHFFQQNEPTNAVSRRSNPVQLTRSTELSGADEKMGEEVKAYIVLKEGAQLSEAEFISWCKEQFAANKYPRHVEFRDSLPIGNTGKISKLALREEIKSKAPN